MDRPYTFDDYEEEMRNLEWKWEMELVNAEQFSVEVAKCNLKLKEAGY